MKLCLICLRTNRRLKLASNALKEFHNELCKNVVTMTDSCYFCTECEYLLTKFSKFKEKCVKALNIYKKYLTSRDPNKQPMALLYTLLPAPSLGMWSSDCERIGNFIYFTKDLQIDSCNKDESTKDTDNKEIKHEDDKIEDHVIYEVDSEHTDEAKGDSETDDRLDHIEALTDHEENSDHEIQIVKNDNQHVTKINKYVTIFLDKQSKNIIAKNINHSVNLKCPSRMVAKKKAHLDNSETDDLLELEALIDDEDNSDNNNEFATEINEKNIICLESKQSKIRTTNKKTKHSVKLKSPSSKMVAKKKAHLDNSEPDDLLEQVEALIDDEDNSVKDNELVKEKVTKFRNPRKQSKNVAAKKDHSVQNNPSSKMTRKRKALFQKRIESNKKYESVFDIEYLITEEMRVEEMQKRRTYSCYVKAEYKCEVCCQGFKSSKFLDYHTEKWHKEMPGRVCCPLCKIWSPTGSGHKANHNTVYKCKLCPLVTYHRVSMTNHYASHSGKEYHCEECNITLKSQSAYRCHLGRAHRQGSHVCSQCGRGFRSPMGLAIHRSSSSRCTAPQEAPGAAVRCDECDVTLPSQEVYAAHLLDVHKAPVRAGRRLPADDAGLPGYNLNRRRPNKVSGVRHTNTKTQTCRVCSKVGPGFGWLRLHFKREHRDERIDVVYADTRPHLCDVCGAGFVKVYALRDHMRTHSGAKPYKCSLCAKTFRSGGLLSHHMVRHFPPSLPCQLCGKKFKTKANLCSHVKSHTGEKDHKCDICGKGFAHGSTLREHVRGVHNNIRRVRKGGVQRGAAKPAKRKRTETDTSACDSDDSE